MRNKSGKTKLGKTISVYTDFQVRINIEEMRPPRPIKDEESQGRSGDIISSPTTASTTAPVTSYGYDRNLEYKVVVERVFRGSAKVGDSFTISTPATDGMCRVYHTISHGRSFVMEWNERPVAMVTMCDMFHPPQYTSRRSDWQPLTRYVEEMLGGRCEEVGPQSSETPTTRPITGF